MNPLALNPASPHLFNPAGSAHTCIQISRTYDIANLVRLGVATKNDPKWQNYFYC
jgi:hypothetical protein